MGEAPTDEQLKDTKLKKGVQTKVGGGPSDEELAHFSKIFTDNGGDLKKIASSLGVSFKDNAKVKDGQDFAKQFLSGILLAE